ncbi:MAG: hypothetical protein APF81_17515 [Desulfosporosinus sp. BRH_c37]|nr:MAG: hypothetical protein APF81_17515 [Desulfosporosinus sp. BRH_c37]
MKIVDISEKIYSGQIISRVEAKEEVGDEVLEERKVLVPKAITGGRVTHADLGTVKLKKAVDPDRFTSEGDIVIKLSTPYDAAYIEKDDEGLVVPSFCSVIRGVHVDKVDAKFITAYLNTEYVREMLKSKVAGTTMPMIKLSDVKDLEIPNVSLVKQKSLGEAYSLSCQKQDVLREMLDNEQALINSLILNAVKEAQENDQE